MSEYTWGTYSQFIANSLILLFHTVHLKSQIITMLSLAVV